MGLSETVEVVGLQCYVDNAKLGSDMELSDVDHWPNLEKFPSTYQINLVVSPCYASLLPSVHVAPWLAFLLHDPAVVILQKENLCHHPYNLLEREALGAGVSG